MNKKDWVEGLLFAGFRIMSAGCMLLGSLGTIFQLLETWSRFDPNYLGAFIASTLLRPVIVLLAGILLHLLSAKLARRMASGISHS